MALLQMEIPATAIADVRTRRAIIDAISQRVPTRAGHGQRSVRKSRHVNAEVGALVAAGGRRACWAVREGLSVELKSLEA